MSMPLHEHLFRKEFHHWYDRIYRYVACRLPTKEGCEDVVSDVFLHAWNTRNQYVEEEGEILGWLTGIARHKIADYWRTRRPEPWDDEQLDRLVGMTGVSLEQSVDVARLFETVMNGLPQETRALLLLRHKDGLSYEELAEVVGKSSAALRQTFSRLYRTLRHQFPTYDLPLE